MNSAFYKQGCLGCFSAVKTTIYKKRLALHPIELVYIQDGLEVLNEPHQMVCFMKTTATKKDKVII